MKRFFIMLLIACSAVSTISADSAATPQKKAKSVVKDLEGIIAFYAKEGSETTSITKNPETGLVEASERIVPFTCKKEDLWAIPIGFRADEPLSYQYMHLQPGSTELFDLKVVTNNGQKSKNVRIRTNTKQEMWFMCCKNPDNPQLRDAYAIVWEETKDNHVAGTVFMITSLRPDMYEKNMSSAGLISDNQNTFTIDGRVGYDLNDSLYVVYMADSAEELDNVADDAYVATMPVVNKRFSFSVQLDKPKVGRIRTVMPDGSLCKLWTNLDFVPGETYRITTHNGYYDEDRDYEQRVGRQSGKSLLNDVQRRGVDDQSGEAVVADAVPVVGGNTDARQDWRNSLAPQYQKQLQLKSEVIGMEIEKIMANYQLIADEMEGLRDPYKIGTIFEKNLKLNKELDKKFQDIIKFAKECHCPASQMPELYKEILRVYTEQNKGVNEFYKEFGYSRETKPARKLQEFLTKQTEKYLKDLEKSLIE
jgi:hypothetical protein